MYAQAKTYPNLPPQRLSPSPGRLLLLTLGFLAAAVVAYSLVPLLPAARYTLAPALPLLLPDSLASLAVLLPEGLLASALALLGLLRGTLPELALWGLAAAIPACPALPMGLAMWRGGCFGAVLAMATAKGLGPAVLGGVTPWHLVWPMLCTAVLFWFAAVPPCGGFPCAWVKRFLAASGGVFALVLAGGMAAWPG